MFEQGLAEFAFYGNRVVLVILLLASIVNVGLFIERHRFFRKYLLSNARALGTQILEMKSVTELRKALRGSPSIETKLVLQGLDGADSAQEFEKRVEGHAALARVEWERHTGLFAWTSSNGPLAGLLGTVLGLMKSFSDLAVAAVPDASVAMAGIADALLTTVLGIVVAIPATAFFNYCKMRGRRAAATVTSLTALVLARGLIPNGQRESTSEIDTSTRPRLVS